MPQRFFYNIQLSCLQQNIPFLPEKKFGFRMFYENLKKITSGKKTTVFHNIILELANWKKKILHIIVFLLSAALLLDVFIPPVTGSFCTLRKQHERDTIIHNKNLRKFSYKTKKSPKSYFQGLLPFLPFFTNPDKPI